MSGLLGWLKIRLVIVAALQGWAVIARLGGIGRRIGIVIRRAGTAQSWLVALATVIQLALVLDARQTGFDVVELRCGHHVLCAWRQQGGYLLLRCLNAIGGLRVTGKCFGNHVRLGFLKILELFADDYESLRSVPRTLPALHTSTISL